MLTVRKIEYPEQRELFQLSVFLPPYHLIQPSPAKLRFALGIPIEIGLVVLQKRNYPKTFFKRFGEILRLYKFQIVRRGVVFIVTAVRSAHKAAYGKIKAGRAELPFIVTIRGEV